MYRYGYLNNKTNKRNVVVAHPYEYVIIINNLEPNTVKMAEIYGEGCTFL